MLVVCRVQYSKRFRLTLQATRSRLSSLISWWLFFENHAFSSPPLNPPPFGEELYSFTRVRMYVCMCASIRRRSEDTGRILTFNI